MLPGISGIAGIRNQKTFTYQDFKNDTAIASSYTLAGAAIGTAYSGRLVIVGLSIVAETTSTPSSVTIGGVSASIHVTQGTSSGDYVCASTSDSNSFYNCCACTN